MLSFFHRLNKKHRAEHLLLSRSYPELLLLLPECFILDGGWRQLAEAAQSFLKPRPHLLVSLPELTGQRLGSLQLQRALRVQLADDTVLLQQSLSLGLMEKQEDTLTYVHILHE